MPTDPFIELAVRALITDGLVAQGDRDVLFHHIQM